MPDAVRPTDEERVLKQPVERLRVISPLPGLVEGRLHLLAYAFGASASGMTFIDREVPTLLGEPLDALLFTSVGVPEYVSAAGGLPVAPTAVRKVAER